MPRLITTWFGVFIVDKGKVMDHLLFPKDPVELAARLRSISDDKVLTEEQEMAKDIKDLRVGEERLSKLGKVSKSIRDRELSSIPEVYGFSKSLLQQAMLQLGRTKIKEVAEDRYIIQAVRAIDDLNKTANLLSERLHEWYSLHFPELGRDLPDERYASLIAKLGDRDKIAEETGMDVTSSVGAELTDRDRSAIMAYAEALDRIYKTRKSMESFIEDRMKEVAANLAYLVGPILGARLIALAGGIERLARLPASTIQMLGAEKAFFKHLTEGGDMPKHGVIFQHPHLHASPYWQRGKIARAFASKIAIAAKTDSYSDKFLAEDLKEALDRRMAYIQKRFSRPPRPKSKSRTPIKKKVKKRKGRGARR